MSVKSTITLTREEAVKKAVKLFFETEQRRMTAAFSVFPDAALEAVLMDLNDEVAGGEGFENYSIQS